MSNFLDNIYIQISKDNFLIALIAAFLVAWTFYRLAKREERSIILESLTKELNLHSYWMNGQYFTSIFSDPSWKDPKYIVFKLSTIAIDNAISKGALIFLNKDLVLDLTVYKQKVSQFNQLVDAAQQFQSNINLWQRKNINKKLLVRMAELTGTIHWYGVGNSSESYSAHNAFMRVHLALEEEKNTKLFWFIWLLFAINLFRIKKLLIKFL